MWFSGFNDITTDFNFGNSGTLDDGDITNNDFIDLSAFYTNLGELYADQADDGVLNQSNDGVGGADYSDNSQFGAGEGITFQGASANSSSFTAENTGVTCFTSGTVIRTPKADVLIEELRVGDLVCTMDNGPQAIRWIGRRVLGPAELQTSPKLRPVLIRRGMLGAERDLLVSRQHSLLIGKNELVRAVHLTDVAGLPVRIANGKKHVTYIHLMFDAHQIIFAENIPLESFYPGPMALQMLSRAALEEIMVLFPDCTAGPDAADVAQAYSQTARQIVNRRKFRLDLAAKALFAANVSQLYVSAA